jgi:sulfur carrier protein
MRIDLNGEPVTTEAATLAALLDERGLPPASVATALDGTFIPRARRETTPLAVGARVEVLAPMQGG